jgi:hypothetical protein
MIKNLIKSVLHVVGSENLLRPNELEASGTKTIAELLHEEETQKTENTEDSKEQQSERS